VAQNASMGTFPVTLTGMIGTMTHALSVQLTVGNVVTNVTPMAATVPAGGEANFTVTLTSQNGFSGDFNFTCTNDVGSLFCTATPWLVTLPADGPVSTELNVAIESKAGLPSILVKRPSSSRFRPPRNHVVFAAFLIVTFFTLLYALFRFPRRRPLYVSAGFALLLNLAIVLGSCGGGGGGEGNGGGGGGGGGAATIHVEVQAISGGLTIPVGKITITVP
jgi:hypothetical protein